MEGRFRREAGCSGNAGGLDTPDLRLKSRRALGEREGFMAEASPGARARPLSPHLQIWRWHVTMLTSILHRATGVALYGGALVLAGWAVALARGEGAYEKYMNLM